MSAASCGQNAKDCQARYPVGASLAADALQLIIRVSCFVSLAGLISYEMKHEKSTKWKKMKHSLNIPLKDLLFFR